jgi:protein-tyrosine-phosphatase/DNA-binding transcriptional ArsR family regulator
MNFEERAAVHRALGDPARLAVVDALAFGEASPTELQALLAMPSNLLAHHVGVLERAGIVRRTRSEGDRRRTYLGLITGVLDGLLPASTREAPRVVFVCTQNSARSQMAAALWNAGSDVPATSAGTDPAAAVHPGAVAAARRRHVPLRSTTPQRVADVLRPDDLVITVCDRAHEELAVPATHWSVADPARAGDEAAFDDALTDLAGRISRLVPAVHPPGTRSA